MAEPSRAQHDAAARALALYEYGAIYPDRLDSQRIQEEAGLIAKAVVNAEPATPSEQYRDGYEDGIQAAAAAVAKVHWESAPNPVGAVPILLPEGWTVEHVSNIQGAVQRALRVDRDQQLREQGRAYLRHLLPAAAQYIPPRDVSDPDKG